MPHHVTWNITNNGSKSIATQTQILLDTYHEIDTSAYWQNTLDIEAIHWRIHFESNENSNYLLYITVFDV